MFYEMEPGEETIQMDTQRIQEHGANSTKGTKKQ